MANTNNSEIKKYASRKFTLAIVCIIVVVLMGLFEIGMSYVSLIPVIYATYAGSNVLQHNKQNGEINNEH